MKSPQFPRYRASQAFTFVEVFAAMLFLAILIPAIVQGLKVATRASEDAERGSIAGELAQNKMNEIVVSGSAENETSDSGDFGTDWPGYRWQVTSQTWSGDSVNLVTQLTVQVFYQVQAQEHSFQLDTLVSGTSQNQTATQSSTQTSSTNSAQGAK